MVCLDVSPEQVLLHSVKGGVGVSDALHRHCHLSILMTQLLIDLGRPGGRASIKFGTRSGFGSVLSHLSSASVSFFSHEMGINMNIPTSS